ncbi:unnamed protein product [Rangifer tarandus platyrhynchus]|uniref:Uncharacterized protein n=1 Tax=Rangifer tarandus platyrhynchus TaxID=3082113 RepID=A0AC59Z376_RANTA
MGASLVTEVGRALGARISQPLSARSGFVGNNPWGDCRRAASPCAPCGLQAGTRGLLAGFSWFGKPGEWRLVTARWAAREGSRRLRTQVRRLLRELRAGEVTAVAVGSKSFFPKEWSQLRIRASALQGTGPEAQVQFHLLRNKNNTCIPGLLRSVNEVMNASVACVAM